MRVTGRFLGLCLAASLAPAAVCAVPAGDYPVARLPVSFNSDIPPPSTGAGIQTARRLSGARADEPGSPLPACEGQPAHAVSPDAKTTAVLQSPAPLPMLSDADSEGMHTPGDGVRRTSGARSAVLDSDKPSLGIAQPAAVAPDDQPLGLKVRVLKDSERALYGVAQGGLIVTAVGQGAAQQAGFKQGDVMLTLDGISLTSADQFYQLLRQRPRDRPVPVLVHRSSSDLFLPLASRR